METATEQRMDWYKETEKLFPELSVWEKTRISATIAGHSASEGCTTIGHFLVRHSESFEESIGKDEWSNLIDEVLGTANVVQTKNLDGSTTFEYPRGSTFDHIVQEIEGRYGLPFDQALRKLFAEFKAK